MMRIVRTLVLLLLLAAVPGAARAAAPATVYVVFVPGMCPWPHSDRYCGMSIDPAARGRATFATLIGQMDALKLRYTPLFFSYRADGGPYSIFDTQESLGHAVHALNVQITAVQARDPHAGFLLVGYSLGGVVAAGWVATHPAEVPAVRGVVTFDSPVRGVGGSLSRALSAEFLVGTVWASLKPSGHIVQQINAPTMAAWEATHLHTVANAADLVVPPAASQLGDTRLVDDRSCDRDILIFRSCHGSVLKDVALNRWVALHWIAPALGPLAG